MADKTIVIPEPSNATPGVEVHISIVAGGAIVCAIHTPGCEGCTIQEADLDAEDVTLIKNAIGALIDHAKPMLGF